MVNIVPSPAFKKAVKHIDSKLRERLEKLIRKIISNPTLGKPLKYMRGERVVRIKPLRLIYAFNQKEQTLYLLKLEHRKNMYE